MPHENTYANLTDRQRDQLAQADLRIMVAAARVCGAYGVPVEMPGVGFAAQAVEHRARNLAAVATALDAVADLVEAE